MLFIIYGIATEQSIGKLFLAGILPGILLMALFMITIMVLVKYNPSLAPVSEKACWRERIETFREGGLLEVFIVFIISLGGLFLGWFTPTEAGAVGSLSLIAITFIEKNKLAIIKNALLDTTKFSAMVFY